MTAPEQAQKTLSSRTILAITVAALAVGTVIVFGAVLPAEFNRDPSGLGKMTGLARLWAPSEVAFEGSGSGAVSHEYDTGFRSDVVNIPLRQFKDPTRGNALEYKVSMKKGATLIYEWSVAELTDPKEFYTDFHGQTLTGAQEETVATYKEAEAVRGSGALTAPFDGIHGWYVENRSPQNVVMQIKISGFYSLVPPGDPGNDGGINANVPAEHAFDLPPDEPQH